MSLLKRTVDVICILTDWKTENRILKKEKLMLNMTYINKTKIFSLALLSLLMLSLNAKTQELWERDTINDAVGYHVDVNFINPDTGFMAIKTNGNPIKIFRTTNKGTSFEEVWSDYADLPEFAIAMSPDHI